MNQRLQYLSKRSQVLTENIARSDVAGAMRKDLVPFKNLINKQKTTNKESLSSYGLNIKGADIINSGQGIERELEVLEMSHNTLNQQTIVDIFSIIKKLYKTALGKS